MYVFLAAVIGNNTEYFKSSTYVMCRRCSIPHRLHMTYTLN